LIVGKNVSRGKKKTVRWRSGNIGGRGSSGEVTVYGEWKKKTGRGGEGKRTGRNRRSRHAVGCRMEILSAGEGEWAKFS